MRLHVLVEDAEAASRAVAGGATVVQLRAKGLPTDELVEIAHDFLELLPAVTFVVNDDVDAAILAGADGVHLGRNDVGTEQALNAGLLLGLSASSVEEALAAEDAGATYIGAGPVWATPSKPDADPPIGLGGLAAIAEAVSLPVVAIGGIDVSNAPDCVRAGATGVAVIRAGKEVAALRAAIDAAHVGKRLRFPRK